ncbi:MAG TPA: ISL3 family transposase, partial [Chloroflexota bacterium]|nr:ISL3 family transposase [Chloroflexota bacterium]
MHVDPVAFLPHIRGLRLDHVVVTADLITLTLTCVRASAPCPLCQRPSTKVHSSYTRTVADLPWSDRRVSLCVQTRRFVCAVATCARKIFCERLPDLVAVSARRTHNLRARLQQIGMALAGRAGARLAQAQGTPLSRTTLLRLVRAMPQPVAAVPRALGIDDWAQHKGHTYGTILVDLAQHQVVDLLPDRTAETVASWLQEHPGIAVISRDRGQTYTEGATLGAPEAVQVADRWHIAKNLGEALERYVARHQRVLQDVARAVADAVTPGPAAAAAPAPAAPPRLTRRQQEHDQRRARRLARYEEVRARFHQGQSQRAIAAHMGVNGKTVRRYLQAETFPEMQPRRRRRQVDPYVAYLQQRWAAGCHNGRR